MVHLPQLPDELGKQRLRPRVRVGLEGQDDPPVLHRLQRLDERVQLHPGAMGVVVVDGRAVIFALVLHAPPRAAEALQARCDVRAADAQQISAGRRRQGGCMCCAAP